MVAAAAGAAPAGALPAVVAGAAPVAAVAPVGGAPAAVVVAAPGVALGAGTGGAVVGGGRVVGGAVSTTIVAVGGGAAAGGWLPPPPQAATPTAPTALRATATTPAWAQGAGRRRSRGRTRSSIPPPSRPAADPSAAAVLRPGLVSEVRAPRRPHGVEGIARRVGIAVLDDRVVPRRVVAAVGVDRPRAPEVLGHDLDVCAVVCRRASRGSPWSGSSGSRTCRRSGRPGAAPGRPRRRPRAVARGSRRTRSTSRRRTWRRRTAARSALRSCTTASSACWLRLELGAFMPSTTRRRAGRGRWEIHDDIRSSTSPSRHPELLVEALTAAIAPSSMWVTRRGARRSARRAPRPCGRRSRGGRRRSGGRMLGHVEGFSATPVRGHRRNGPPGPR